MKAIKANYALSLDVQYHTLDLLYTPFWTRIGAYIVGMLSGHYLSIQRTEMLIPKVSDRLSSLDSILDKKDSIFLVVFQPDYCFVSTLSYICHTRTSNSARQSFHWTFYRWLWKNYLGLGNLLDYHCLLNGTSETNE